MTLTSRKGLTAQLVINAKWTWYLAAESKAALIWLQRVCCGPQSGSCLIRCNVLSIGVKLDTQIGECFGFKYKHIQLCGPLAHNKQLLSPHL